MSLARTGDDQIEAAAIAKTAVPHPTSITLRPSNPVAANRSKARKQPKVVMASRAARTTNPTGARTATATPVAAAVAPTTDVHATAEPRRAKHSAACRMMAPPMTLTAAPPMTMTRVALLTVDLTRVALLKVDPVLLAVDPVLLAVVPRPHLLATFLLWHQWSLQARVPQSLLGMTG